MSVSVENYNITNVYKPPSSRISPTTLPTLPFPSLYAGDFNCQPVDWGYTITSSDGESLAAWAASNNLAVLYNPKDPASFLSGRWGTGRNPDLDFVRFDSDSSLPDRCVLEKFPRSQHRPSLVTPPKLVSPIPSKPVKR